VRCSRCGYRIAGRGGGLDWSWDRSGLERIPPSDGHSGRWREVSCHLRFGSRSAGEGASWEHCRRRCSGCWSAGARGKRCSRWRGRTGRREGSIPAAKSESGGVFALALRGCFEPVNCERCVLIFWPEKTFVSGQLLIFVGFVLLVDFEVRRKWWLMSGLRGVCD